MPYQPMSAILDICNELPTVAYDRGQSVLTEGHKSDVLFVLKSGAVDILKGDVVINTVSSRGSIFGEVSVLLGRAHMASVVARENSEFYHVTHALEFLHAHPSLNFELARVLAYRLDLVTSYLVDLKSQYEANDDHLGMVDEVLESILQQHCNREG